MITPTFYPIRGGTESIVESLSIRLNKMGVPTDVMTLNMDRRWQTKHYTKWEEIHGIRVIKVGALNFLSRFPVSLNKNFCVNVLPLKFQEHLKSYDVLHYHGFELTFPFFSLFIKKPKILQPHEYFLPRRKYGLPTFVFSHAADMYLAISEQVETELLELGIHEHRISRFPNSVDTDVFHPCETKLENTLLYVGRMIPSKGVHVILHALKYLRRPVHLVVIGAPDWGSPYFQNVMKQIDLVNGLGVHRVSYLGNIGQAELLEWYRKASLFVFPSVDEPFGIVLLEALASSTPVVSVRSGGIPEAVKDGENALLIPERNNPKDLAEAIEYLLGDDVTRLRFGRNGRNWVCQNYSSDVAATNLKKVYTELLVGSTS